MRKLGDQWVEVVDGQEHMVKLVKSTTGCSGCAWHLEHDDCIAFPFVPCIYNESIIKDLGILNEDGCLPAPWDETKYPKITVLVGNVYNIEVMEGFWFMQVRGDTKEKAIERWNRRA